VTVVMQGQVIEDLAEDAVHRAEADAPSLIGRLSSRQFVSRPPETDLDTYYQVEHALESGLTTEEVVRREFERSFGVMQIE
jgi:hypothetical protein